ncbi:sigma-70 family RNA polymerase sigma factor [Mariniphaga sediminis]|jgi:RNA polymerase sigma factor (sigma-70 family)|uniref:Sigma-70 family RNA polymerase sigma factor n=1 Tax=Mariniphaga sediminis TaxID=1628158 RepID=A0A399D0A8_9BACT|nr:sigma-70 family RNA polymerase sigma factor [Mariniphaga sediminis]RIH64896.1 sigma-70 family RNA polymerase sigma factor [Mariniphaga sediminis]
MTEYLYLLPVRGNQSNEMEQIELSYWVRFKRGDQEALGIIFQTYFNEMYYYGMKIIPMPDLVKDVIQEMFVHLWERRKQIGEVTKVKPYLLVTLRNELIHRTKNNRFSEMEKALKTEAFTLGAEDFIIGEENSKELNKRLVDSLNQLSERQREVIMLRFFHNFGFDELAEILDMNVQSVRNLLFRALEKIRKDLKDTGFHSADNIEIILFNLFQKKLSLSEYKTAEFPPLSRKKQK